MTLVVLKERQDLFELPQWASVGSDSSGEPVVWQNNYHCESGETWSDDWSCQCDDDCPCCGESYTAESSDWIGPDDLLMRALWESLPDEAGARKRAIAVNVMEDGSVMLDPAWSIVGTEAAPEVVAMGPWPGFDAYARKMIKDLHPDCVVYACDNEAGQEGSFRLEVAHLIAGQISSEAPVRALEADNTAYVEFYSRFNEPQPLSYPQPADTGMEP